MAPPHIRNTEGAESSTVPPSGARKITARLTSLVSVIKARGCSDGRAKGGPMKSNLTRSSSAADYRMLLLLAGSIEKTDVC
jgi:hypothetical protein